ncbi:MAG: replication-associated recombination protein A [Chrysiogenales bacterium]|nr:MAG: replication-associated recombination protein A [Chrysiogenales bacterium]
MTEKQDRLSPLADRCRPLTIEEFIGQEHLLSGNRILRNIIDKGAPFSLILWGEPGSVKTTLARIIASTCAMDSHFLSAISAGVADVRRVIERGRVNREKGVQTLLFLDEIHRFNKAQQDSVLGSVETGDIVLIGATTENPSFNVISPLLSRTRVLKLGRLSEPNLIKIMDQALGKDRALIEGGARFESDQLKEKLAAISNGDARRMLNILEAAFALAPDGLITDDHLEEAVRNSMLYYDRAGERHYDTISAFIKSLRGSDPDAAVYYLARMILAGEDPVFIARRMVIFASEDVGNAAPTALTLAVSAMTATQNIGLPEARIILSQCAVFLASAPKSNASYRAIEGAMGAAGGANYEIPLHLRNAPTDLMKKHGYGKGYRYPHDFEGHFVKEAYLPDEIAREVFYRPSDQGGEKAILDRLKSLWPDRYKG